MQTVLAIIILLGLFVLVFVLPEQRKERQLRGAAPGETRIEAAVKAHQVDSVVKRYAKQGWEVVEQSTGKSFGSGARVTVTFRKRS